MTNRNKARGTDWETAGVRYLNTALDMYDDDGFLRDAEDPNNVRRIPQTGRFDTGDVWAVPFCLEFKNVAKIDLPAFVEQANREAVNARLPFGAAVVKRRGKGPAHGYVVMDMATFAGVVEHIRDLRANTPGGSGT